MKRFLIGATLGMVLLVSGCGSTNVLDNYSFGNKVIDVGQSEVIVASPFDMGKLETITSNDKGQPVVAYENMDQNFIVSVTATQASAGEPLPTIEQAVESNRQFFVKRIDEKVAWKSEVTQIDGVRAIHSSVTYMNKNQKTSLSQYTFINRGVLWNITYQHGAANQAGSDIMKRVDGHIQITKKEG